MPDQYTPPIIGYISKDEYHSLLNQLKTDYQSMIIDGLTLVKEKLHTWALYHDGPSMGVSGHWSGEGVQLWLKLTKGMDEPWCNLMSAMLYFVISTNCKTAFCVQRTTSKKRQTNQQIYDMLQPIIQDAINEFIQPSYWPNHMDAFEDINFPDHDSPTPEQAEDLQET